VTVTDSNGCSITGAPLKITEPAQLGLTQSQVNNVCFQGNAGSLSITASGGTAPYSYAWTGPNNFSASVANPQNLVSGTYQVTVIDANGCTPLVGPPITITEPPVVTINAEIQSESCADAKDGRIELTLSGGTPPYTLTWEHGDGDAIADELGAGTYRVRVNDQAGCSQTAEYSLLPVTPLSLQTTTTLQATQVPLQISALIQAQIAGGTPPYTYRWSTGQSSSQITVAQSGVYLLVVKDSQGCTQESEVEVTVPLPMNLSLQINSVALCEEGGQETTVQLQLAGGLPPYQITWSRGAPSSDGKMLTTRESGVFDVEVKDALGLVEKRSFTIAPRLTGPLDFSYLFASQAEFQANLVGYAVNFSSQATWPFTMVSWDFGDESSSAVPFPIHRYANKGTYLVTLAVLDAAGCLNQASQEIQVLDYYLQIPNVFTPNGDQLNDTFFPKFRFVRNLQLQVMNLWGQLIYRSQGQEDPGWDGFVSGQKAPEGVYVYTLRYQVPDGRTITSSSTFFLAR
jgi:gliding motility-associated-like protein